MSIGENDLVRKMNQAQKFLEKRNQVRIQVFLKGREKNHPERAVELLNEIVEKYFKTIGQPANKPTTRNLSVMINPSKNK